MAAGNRASFRVVAVVVFTVIISTCYSESIVKSRWKRFGSSPSLSPFANLLSSRSSIMANGHLNHMPSREGMSVTADLGRPKRALFDESCKGVYDRHLFSKLDRVCEDCYNLYRTTSVSYECRGDCFQNPTFHVCVQELLLDASVYAQYASILYSKHGALKNQIFKYSRRKTRSNNKITSNNNKNVNNINNKIINKITRSNNKNVNMISLKNNNKNMNKISLNNDKNIKITRSNNKNVNKISLHDNPSQIVIQKIKSPNKNRLNRNHNAYKNGRNDINKIMINNFRSNPNVEKNKQIRFTLRHKRMTNEQERITARNSMIENNHMKPYKQDSINPTKIQKETGNEKILNIRKILKNGLKNSKKL